MAKLRGPANSESARGNLGKKTFLGWRGQNVARTATGRKQPGTPRQRDTQGIQTATMREFRNLTDAQKTAWLNYAAATPYSDSLGQNFFPTSANAFSKCNFYLLDNSENFIYDPPATANTWNFTSYSITAETNPGTITIATLITASVLNYCFLEISLSQGFKSAQRKARTCDYRHYSYHKRTDPNGHIFPIENLTEHLWYYVKIRIIDKFGQTGKWIIAHLQPYSTPATATLGGDISGDTSLLGDYNTQIKIYNSARTTLIETIYLINNQITWTSNGYYSGTYDIVFESDLASACTPNEYDDIILTAPTNRTDLTLEVKFLSSLTGLLLGDIAVLGNYNAKILIYDSTGIVLLETINLTNNQINWTSQRYEQNTFDILVDKGAYTSVDPTDYQDIPLEPPADYAALNFEFIV